MSKLAKIYYINIGGYFRFVKAFSKSQIADKLNMTMHSINSDCEIFSLKEWDEDMQKEKIDFDLTAAVNETNKTIINTFEITRLRKEEQLSKGENTRVTKYIPFSERYELKTINYGLYFLIELGVKDNKDQYIIPDYQRELVWTTENKQNLIYAIMNGSPIGEFIFAKDTVDTKTEYYHKWIVIDGQQRINALKEFVLNTFADLDGRYFKDYSYREMTYFLENYTNFNFVSIKNLSLKEQVEIYISKNIGGVVHSNEEIEKAKSFLESIQYR